MVRAEVIEPERVAVSGVVPGEPLLIRISYHPRWRSANGERIWLAGQGFMLVFPSTDRVDLIYSQTAVTRAASAISGVSVVGTILVFAGMFQVRSRSARQPKWAGNSVGQSERTASTGSQKSYKSPSFVTGICVTSALLIASGYRARSQDADIVYRSAQRELDRGNMAEARARFVRARSLAPFSNTAIHSFYFEAIAFYREEKWSEASAVFQQLLRTFPEAPSAAEAKYHIGLCADRLGRRQEAIAAMNETRLRYPLTIWSEFAESRLREWGER
jgi:TolA-binding protein